MILLIPCECIIYMVCKGICLRHKAMRPKDGGMRYLKGQKRCQVCQVFIYWRGSYCPCCGYKLRVNPRNGKFKLTLRNKNNNKKQHKESITNLLD